MEKISYLDSSSSSSTVLARYLKEDQQLKKEMVKDRKRVYAHTKKSSLLINTVTDIQPYE